jgi:hypothetical protein
MVARIEAGSLNTLVVTNGRVGIGTNAPTDPLHVAGVLAVDGSTIRIRGGQATISTVGTVGSGRLNLQAHGGGDFVDIDRGNFAIGNIGGPHIRLHNDAANVLGQRAGTTPNTNRLYRTFTGTARSDNTNAAWLEFAADAALGVLSLRGMADGSNQTHTAIHIGSAGTNLASGILVAPNDLVGIGTTTPRARLHVHTGATAPGAAWYDSSSILFSAESNTTHGVAIAVANNTASTRPVLIGRRSRGTLASPSAVASGDRLFSLVSGGHDGSTLHNAGIIDFIADATPTSGNVPTRIAFITGSNATDRTEKMSIKPNGNVGIGTNNPQVALHVNGDATFDGPGASATIKIGRNGNNWIANAASATSLDMQGAARLTLRVNNAEHVRVESSGSVGIGTNAPAAKLHVQHQGSNAVIAVTGITNATPANASTVVAWLPISVNGTNFFMPLYQ